MKIEDIQNIYRHDFGSFIRFGFHTLHPGTDYHHNWHVDVMAHYLTKVLNGECKRLIINMPPRMLKSHCASVALPAWLLGRDPRKRILYLHGSKALGLELEEACLELMKSKRYRALFPTTIIKEEKGKLGTSFGGRRQFMTITSRLTGLGSDIIIIDDPVSTAEVREEGARRRLQQQFDENILQRLDDKKNGAIVLAMQRLHEEDLSAYLLAKNEGWVHLNLSAVAMQDECWNLPYGRIYERKKGDILHPARETRDQLIETLLSVGGHGFSYQYLQGSYKPHFGDAGEGCIYITPFREGVFWDARKEQRYLHGFYHFTEKHLILPRVFGIGQDPCPPDMRQSLTKGEWEIGAQETMKYQERLRLEYEARQSAL